MEQLSELSKLKIWWLSNKDIWFNSNDHNDTIVTNKFANLLNIDISINKLNLQIDECLGYIILNDQVIRHVVRLNNLFSDEISKRLNNIIPFVKTFYEYNKNKMNDYEFYFTLLPLRHTNIYENQLFVLTETWSKIKMLSETDLFYKEKLHTYKKYLNATYDHMCDKNIIEVNFNIVHKYEIHKTIELFVKNFDDIFDKNTILYRTNNNHNLIQKNNSIVNMCCKFSKSDKIILSISGGVDSMILSWIFYKLNLNFVMVHINYSNKKECEKEVKFLSMWAKYINVKLFIKNIDEINRKTCMNFELRKTYESYTRNVRYNSYVQTSKKMNWSSYYVVLGHNSDDCFENILTNISNKKCYDNLNGMNIISPIVFKNNIIQFCRPILSISKAQIYKYAHYNNIPYLRDSTMSWSQRGKIRDEIKPILTKWNPNIINGLCELKDIMKESLECIDILADSWKQKLKCDVMNNINVQFIIIDLCDLVESKIFWNRFLLKMKIKISSKSLNNLINKIITIKKKFKMLQINVKNVVELSKINKCIFWKNSFKKLILSFTVN